MQEDVARPQPSWAPSTLRGLEPYALQARQHWPGAGRHILAHSSEEGVVVYQAYRPSIGEEAARQGRFLGVPGFSPTRMTWVKTNFCWMMYRCGWACKPDQETVLAITLRWPFFEEILWAACPSSAEGRCQQSDVVLQWDPDHLPNGGKHPARRAIQLGLRGPTRDRYISGSEIASIEDITPLVHAMRSRAMASPGAHGAASEWAGVMVPSERVLPLAGELREHIAADEPPPA